MNNPPWFKQHIDNITLSVKVKPGKKQNKLSISLENMLTLSLQAPAENGQANKMMIKYLSKLLQVPQNKIMIESGSVNRSKVLCIKAMLPEQNRIKTLILNAGKQ